MNKVMRIYSKIICIILISYQTYAERVPTSPDNVHSSVANPLQEGSWFFMHPLTVAGPLQLELKGANQIDVENLAVFNGIANNQKVARFTLAKGIKIARSAVFGTNKIQTTRGNLAINSAIHFQNSATYQFRMAQATQTTWDHLSSSNMSGTQEIEPGPDRHINGYISYEGSGTFIFPVGNGNAQFHPLTVNGNDGQIISTAWISGDPSQNLDSTDSQPAHSIASLAGKVKSIYPNGQWDWHIRSSGTILSNGVAPTNIGPTSPIYISVTIPADINLINANSDNLRLVGWNGSAWEELGNASTTPGKVNASINKVFSAITLGTVEQDALPVKLITFAANKEEKSSVLTWQTSEETDSKSFEIERSANGTYWTSLSSVLSNGNSQSVTKYKYIDKTPLIGNNLYRLKMIDIDDTFAYSSITSLNFTDGTEKVIIYPNPASDLLTIQTDYDWKLVERIDLYNQSGKIMYTSSHNPEKSIWVKNLPVGNYVLSLVKKDGSRKPFSIVIYH